MSGELPEGWAVATLGTLGRYINGRAFKPREWEREGLPIIRIQNLNDPSAPFNYSSKIYDDRVRVRNGDLLIAWSASLGAFVWRGGEAWLNQHIFRVEHDERLCTRDFLLHAVRHALDDLYDKAHGTGIVHVTKPVFESHEVPLPPLPEQVRIVAKLEGLQCKVDACQERLASIRELLRRFRHAVLAAACSGRLTADWREETQNVPSAADLLDEIRARRKELWAQRHGATRSGATFGDYPQPASPNNEQDFDVPESWVRCSMDELTTAITSGSRDWKRYYQPDGSGTFLMAQNVRPLKLDRGFRLGVAPPESDRDRKRSEVRKNDLLVTIVGANTGDSCRVPCELVEHYVCQSVALMRPVLSSTSPFLELFLNSEGHGLAQYRRWMYGEGRPHLSFDHLRETAVCLPQLAEQEEVVRRVKALFAVADGIAARLAKAQAQVVRLSPSLLAKAFRGDLVPTEAELARREGRSFEPASVLLDRVREGAVHVEKRVARNSSRPPRIRGSASSSISPGASRRARG